MMAETMGRLWVNGEERPWEGGNLVAFLRAYGLDPEARGFAVALNGAMVPRQAWATTELSNDDRLEVVGMFKGG